MLKRSTIMMACFGASLAGCGEKPSSLPPPNPNILSCHAAGTGHRYAAPVTVRSDCWKEDAVQLVFRGTAPSNNQTAALVVRGKAGVGTLTRHDSPHDKPGCHMKLSLEELGLECRGDVSGDSQAVCYRGDDPKPVCSLNWKVTEPYDQYHPVDEFPKYIDDHPED